MKSRYLWGGLVVLVGALYWIATLMPFGYELVKLGKSVFNVAGQLIVAGVELFLFFASFVLGFLGHDLADYVDSKKEPDREISTTWRFVYATMIGVLLGVGLVFLAVVLPTWQGTWLYDTAKQFNFHATWETPPLGWIVVGTLEFLLGWSIASNSWK